MPEINSKHPLTTFLPYNPSLFTTNLKVKVNEYLFLVKNLLKTINLLKKDEFNQFDPLIGDNACHIRALKICMSFSNCLTSFLCSLSEIENVKNSIDNLIDRNEIPVQGSLVDFLVKKKLTIELSNDELFIIGCHLLTIVKKFLPAKADRPLLLNETTTPLALKDLGVNISGQFSRNLVNHLRQFIASASVEYMRQEVRFVSCSEVASTMISSDQTFVHNKLQCISIFWSTLIMMERTLQLKIPIILTADQKASDNYRTINQTSVLLKPIENYYSKVDPKREDLDQVAIIIKGTSCRPYSEQKSKQNWINELLKHQPIDLFLASSANHRQFPDPSQDYLITRYANPKFEEYRQKSIQWGCCLDNPSLFFIFHVYCQKIKNIFNVENLKPSTTKTYHLAVA